LREKEKREFYANLALQHAQAYEHKQNLIANQRQHMQCVEKQRDEARVRSAFEDFASK
jgi:hypothetical protein